MCKSIGESGQDPGMPNFGKEGRKDGGDDGQVGRCLPWVGRYESRLLVRLRSYTVETPITIACGIAPFRCPLLFSFFKKRKINF